MNSELMALLPADFPLVIALNGLSVIIMPDRIES
jgi:hypothetical protein